MFGLLKFIPRIGIRSLRTRIIAWSFIPTLIITIAVALFIFKAYANVTEALLVEQNRDSARFEASQFTIALGEYTNLLSSEARVLGATRGDQPFGPEVLASSANRNAVFDGGVVLLDNYGKVVASEPARPDIMYLDWSNRTYYTQIAHSGTSVSGVFSDIVKDGPGGEDVIEVAVPVTDVNDRFVGILAGMFHIGSTSVSSFYGDIVKLNWGNGRNAYIFDSNGTVIYHTNTDEIGKDVSKSAAVAEAIKGKASAVRTTDFAGTNVLASFAPIPGTPWGMVTEKNWGTLTGSNRGYQTILILLLASGILIPAIIVFFGVKQITRPIAVVGKAAREITEGNFSHRIAISTGDELEEMADQFNKMAGALSESYATLERKVEDRTRIERQRAEQLREINETGQKISSILDLVELLPFVTKSLRESFKYDSVRIFLLDQDSGELKLRASAEDTETNDPSGNPTETTDGIAMSVVATGEPLLLENLTADPQHDFLGDENSLKAIMALPLKVAGKTLGVLEIGESRTSVFDDLDLFSARTLADQLAIAIENGRLYEHAQELAAIDERNRLARDLHDAVSQTLFSANIIAEVLPRIWDKNNDEGRRRLEEVRQLTRSALAEMRTLLLELRPSALVEAELPALLKQLGESIGGRARVPVTVKVVGECSFPSDVKVALYRIAQEALNNIAKHASATEAEVDLVCEADSVSLRIEDNGKGFDINSIRSGSLGVGIMHERAEDIGATVSVNSKPGIGTEVALVWKAPSVTPHL